MEISALTTMDVYLSVKAMEFAHNVKKAIISIGTFIYLQPLYQLQKIIKTIIIHSTISVHCVRQVAKSVHLNIHVLNAYLDISGINLLLLIII